MGKRAEGVGAEEKEELCLDGQGGTEAKQCVVGEVRLAAWREAGAVDEGQREGGIAGDGEARHFKAVFEGRGGAGGLERLEAHGCEENLIEFEATESGPRDGKVAVVRRVKAAAEESCPHRTMVMEQW